MEQRSWGLRIAQLLQKYTDKSLINIFNSIIIFTFHSILSRMIYHVHIYAVYLSLHINRPNTVYVLNLMYHSIECVMLLSIPFTNLKQHGTNPWIRGSTHKYTLLENFSFMWPSIYFQVPNSSSSSPRINGVSYTTSLSVARKLQLLPVSTGIKFMEQSIWEDDSCTVGKEITAVIKIRRFMKVEKG